MVEAAQSEAGTKFAAIGLNADTVKNVLKNKKVTASLLEILGLAEVQECPKEKGALLYALATKLKPVHAAYKLPFAQQIVQDKWKKTD